MPELRLVLALHHHQPVGQLESVIEQAFEATYRPLLDVLEKSRALPVALHTSGPLLEWLVERHPDYIDRLRSLIARGEIEILGGGIFEPVMTMIPHRDRVGQIRAFTEQIQDVFSTHVRGAWLAEGVWEQSLVTSLVQAGIEFTVLDDFHFERGPSQVEGPFGYYLTEAEGHLLKVFPACPALPNGICFVEPNLVHDFLSRLAERRPGSTVVFAVDDSVFGSSSDVRSHVNMLAWLERFCEMIVADGDWLELTTFASLADRTLPLGKVYLSDSAFRWRNLQSRRAEGDEMYARMLGISQRLAAAASNVESDPDYLEVARLELYRGQCSSAYHASRAGAGLYLPHLRNAVYRHLIAAHNALDEIEGNSGPRVRADVGDFNLDARQEVRLENDCLIASVRPAQGGHVSELDLREQLINALATLAHQGKAEPSLFDRHPRKALVDHFYPVEATLEDVVGGRAVDCGDFAVGTFQAKVQRESRRVALIMNRAGRAGDHSIRLRKTISLAAGEATLFVRYEIDQIPSDACLHFGVEINLAGMGEQFQGCSYLNPNGTRLGPSSRPLDLPHENGLRLNDPSSDLCVSLGWSQSAGLWCFPIVTAIQCETGRDHIHQSSAVIPHWHVSPDEQARWEVSIRWSFEQAAVNSAEVRPRDLRVPLEIG
jgi:4-alpha-glucanotransferase